MKAKAFRALARPSHFSLLAQRKGDQKKGPSPTDLQLATGYDAEISTLGILPRVETAHLLCAALRVSRCYSATEVEEIAL